MARRNRYQTKPKKRKFAIVGKLLKIILILANTVVAVALLFAFLSAYLPPSVSITVSYCGLAFPYLLVANLVFVALWLIIDYRLSLISLSLVLININNIDRTFQLRPTEKPSVCASCVKVMSYNAKLFGLYDEETKTMRDIKRNQVYALFERERPEFLCIQEYFYDGSGRLNFPTTDTILQILHLDNVKRNCYQFFPINNKSRDYHYGMVIFSRYRILDGACVYSNDSSTNAAVYVDVKFKSDTLRIYNLHLASMHMNSEDYAMGKDIATKGIDDPNLDKKARILSKKVEKAFLERQEQVRIVRAHIDSCHYPVIVCGDFNDSPVSYAYHKIGHGMKDAFRESGGGRGETYFGDSFPSFRIDYIFHDARFKSFGYTTYDSLKVSDHYPVWTNISLLK
ncbi:MAG: endonuclease/exonuclease/phosphatase family protein [Bacteroidales bacterium]|nr:endonuclease/exonuclease/phosphatase family protein [Bacteroidales bacterium]